MLAEIFVAGVPNSPWVRGVLLAGFVGGLFVPLFVPLFSSAIPNAPGLSGWGALVRRRYSY